MSPLIGIGKDQFDRLNVLLEASFKGAEKDHRFIKLNQEKPIIDGYSRVFEYDPEIDGKNPSIPPLDIKEKTYIAHIGITPQKMQFGKSIITNGGVRDVCTHPIARGIGVGLITMENAKEFMRKEGIDVSILFSGAGHFYEKLGWRGGVRTGHFKIPYNSLIKSLEAIRSHYKSSYDIGFVEEKDLDDIANVCINTSEDLYFAVRRDAEYWKTHFKVRPERYWYYICAKVKNEKNIESKSGRLVSYLTFEIKKSLKKSKEQDLVDIHIKECRMLQEEPSKIFALFLDYLDYIIEESLEYGVQVDSIHLELSKNERIVKKLLEFKDNKIKSNFSFGNPSNLEIIDLSEFHMNWMLQIMNPESFFTNLEQEFKYRAKSTKFPPGKYLIIFNYGQDNEDAVQPGELRFEVDDSSEISNYDLISSSKSKIVLTPKMIVNHSKDFEKLKENYDGIAIFHSISELGMAFCGIIPYDEWEEFDEEEFNYNIELYGKMDKIFSKFTKDITFDMYPMDHF